MIINRRTTATQCALVLALALAGCGQPSSDRTVQEFFGTAASRCPYKKLLQQGFSGVLDQGATIEFVGMIEKGKTPIAIYNYEFNNPETDHGNRRLLILDHVCNYLGSYAVSEAALQVRGDAIVFRDTGTPGSVVEFSGSSLPRTVWLDGEVSELFR